MGAREGPQPTVKGSAKSFLEEGTLKESNTRVRHLLCLRTCFTIGLEVYAERVHRNRTPDTYEIPAVCSLTNYQRQDANDAQLTLRSSKRLRAVPLCRIRRFVPTTEVRAGPRRGCIHHRSDLLDSSWLSGTSSLPSLELPVGIRRQRGNQEGIKVRWSI